MAKSKTRGAKGRKSGKGKKTRKNSGKPKRNAPKRKKTKVSSKKKRTTAQGMRRALKMKHAAEEREHALHPQPTHDWAPEIPQQHKPDPVPNNLQEQGDLANILQNTSNRRAG